MNQLPSNTPPQLPKFADIQAALRKAVSTALDRDFDLIALGAHEQAIAHRVAVYLEPEFPEYHTDCEYNRRKHLTKQRQPGSAVNNQNMRPDILVHRRNTSLNVLAVEMKANANLDSPDDIHKLECLSVENEYQYQAVAFIRIANSPSEIKSGKLIATLTWINAANPVSTPDPNDTLTCDAHSTDVIQIYRQRKQS